MSLGVTGDVFLEAAPARRGSWELTLASEWLRDSREVPESDED